MTFTQELARLNSELGRELGRVEDGRPLYKWIHSEDPALLHPMWTGEFEYHANTESGLILPEPVYKLRKMCLKAEDQWVLCHWIDSPGEYEWRQAFGCAMQWPKKGQYYPTSVTLDAGIVPDVALTEEVIRCIRELRTVSPRQVERQATEAIDRAEAAKKQDLYEEIREACTTYDHVPGARDQVSYPASSNHTEEQKLINA